MLFRLTQFCCVALIFYVFPCASAYAQAGGARFGLWVEAEGVVRPFDSRSDIEKMLEFTDDRRITDLYCQVYRRGRSWFPSVVADDQPFRDAYAQEYAPLELIIDRAHQRGQRVHAWINALRVKDGPERPVFLATNNAVQVDNYGNSVLKYLDNFTRPPGLPGAAYQLDTPGIWLDPSNPEVRNYLVEVVRDVVRAYPKLDGIHLDMIRFPFGVTRKGRRGSMKRIELGYSKESLDGYFRLRSIAAGHDIPRVKLPSGPQWDSWRRSQVTMVVVEIRRLLQEIAPHMELSAAVIADPDRAHKRVFQDWPSWRKQGLLDVVLPMAYSADRARVRRLSSFATSTSGSAEVLMGLGAWLMKSKVRRLELQAADAFRLGADGVVLFSYANLASPRGRKIVERIARVSEAGSS